MNEEKATLHVSMNLMDDNKDSNAIMEISYSKTVPKIMNRIIQHSSRKVEAVCVL